MDSKFQPLTAGQLIKKLSAVPDSSINGGVLIFNGFIVTRVTIDRGEVHLETASVPSLGTIITHLDEAAKDAAVFVCGDPVLGVDAVEDGASLITDPDEMGSDIDHDERGGVMDADIDPYDAGFEAALCGRPETDNPFPPASVHHLSWNDGYLAVFEEGSA
ncbi:hypothetical protein CCP1ISM_110012 [Azospirillaceae bacterium]